MAIGIGVDVGSSSVRVAVLERGSGGTLILRATQEAPCDTARADALTNALTQLRRTLSVTQPVVLGMPSTCPHGNPIPGMTKPSRIVPFPLSQASEGTTVSVERITEEAEADRKLMEHLWRHGVRPGARLTVQEIAPWAGTITAASDGKTIVLGLAAAGKIWVYRPK
mgnify:CR=1 FL=1